MLKRIYFIIIRHTTVLQNQNLSLYFTNYTNNYCSFLQIKHIKNRKCLVTIKKHLMLHSLCLGEQSYPF